MTSRSTLPRRATSTCGGLAGIGASAVLLALAGRTLPFPTAASSGELAGWAGKVGAATATFTVARGIGAVLVAWVALTWAVAVGVRLAGLPAAVRAADGITLPFVRRLADLTAGVAIVAVSLVPAVSAGAATADPTPLMVMSDLGPTSSTATTTTTPPPTTTTAATPPPAAPEPERATPRATWEPTPRAPDSGGDSASGTWVIRPGDTLWFVAEHTAGDRLGRPASPAETATQLDRLVSINADRLAVPGDADLVFPGQEFLIP